MTPCLLLSTMTVQRGKLILQEPSALERAQAWAHHSNALPAWISRKLRAGLTYWALTGCACMDLEFSNQSQSCLPNFQPNPVQLLSPGWLERASKKWPASYLIGVMHNTPAGNSRSFAPAHTQHAHQQTCPSYILLLACCTSFAAAQTRCSGLKPNHSCIASLACRSSAATRSFSLSLVRDLGALTRWISFSSCTLSAACFSPFVFCKGGGGERGQAPRAWDWGTCSTGMRLCVWGLCVWGHTVQVGEQYAWVNMEVHAWGCACWERTANHSNDAWNQFTACLAAHVDTHRAGQGCAQEPRHRRMDAGAHAPGPGLSGQAIGVGGDSNPWGWALKRARWLGRYMSMKASDLRPQVRPNVADSATADPAHTVPACASRKSAPGGVCGSRPRAAWPSASWPPPAHGRQMQMVTHLLSAPERKMPLLLMVPAHTRAPVHGAKEMDMLCPCFHSLAFSLRLHLW